MKNLKNIYGIFTIALFIYSCGGVEEDVVERYPSGNIKVMHLLKGSKIYKKILFQENGDTLGYEMPEKGIVSNFSKDFSFHSNDNVKERHLYRGITLDKKEFYNNREQFLYSIDKDGNKKYSDVVVTINDEVFYDGKKRKRITNALGGKDGVIKDILILDKTLRDFKNGYYELNTYNATYGKKLDTLYWEKPDENYVRILEGSNRTVNGVKMGGSDRNYGDYDYKSIAKIDSVISEIIYFGIIPGNNYGYSRYSTPKAYNLKEVYENGIINKVVKSNRGNMLGTKNYNSDGELDGNYFWSDDNYKMNANFSNGVLDGPFTFTGGMDMFINLLSYSYETSQTNLQDLIDVVSYDLDHNETDFKIEIKANFKLGKLHGELLINSFDVMKDYWEGDVKGTGFELYWGDIIPEFIYNEEAEQLLLYRGEYNLGKLDGDMVQYATTGKILRKGNFKNGKPYDGLFLESRRSKMLKIVIVDKVVNYKKGKKDGFAFYNKESGWWYKRTGESLDVPTLFCLYSNDKITNASIFDDQGYLLRRYDNGIFKENKCTAYRNGEEILRDDRACKSVDSYKFNESEIPESVVNLKKFENIGSVSPDDFLENMLVNISGTYLDRRCNGGTDTYIEMGYGSRFSTGCEGYSADKSRVKNSWIESINYKK